MTAKYQKFEAFKGSFEDRKIPAKEQKRLIRKLQEETISSEEKDILMGSLYNLVIRISRRFARRFPDRTLEDLVSDGLLNLWLRLPSYQEDRGVPSTFAHIVVHTAFCKELKKLNRRSHRRTVVLGYGENAKVYEINVPHMSLSNFVSEDGDEYEPSALGVEDEKRERAESMMAFEEIMLEMYKSVCHSVQEYKILNNILNTKMLPNFGGGRRRKSLTRIAEKADTKMRHVERVANRVRPWLKKHDFLDLLSTEPFRAPMADEVFDKETLDEYFRENEGEDVWTLLNGTV